MAEYEHKLLRYMEEMPVIDSHEHLVPEQERGCRRDILTEYAGQYLGHDLISAGMSRESYHMVIDSALSIEKRMSLLKPWMELIENTGYGRCMKKSLKWMSGMESLIDEQAALAQEAFEKQDAGGTKELLGCLHVKACIIDWMPLEWRYEDPLYIQAYDPLFLLMPEHKNRFLKLEQFTGIPVRDFDSYVCASCNVIEKKAVEQQVRILKLPVAYHRPLVFDFVSKDTAEEEFNQCMEQIIHYRDGISSGLGFGERHAFQNYVLYEILKTAENYGMTVQFHTGYLAGNEGCLPDSHPAGLIPLFSRYPGLSFDLFHMSYPYQMEAGALAKMYPNVYVNLCWAHILSPKAAADALEEWLHILPINKIIGFGGDTHIPFMIPGHLQMAKENIARALARTVEDGLWPFERAQQIAEYLLYKNPKTLYKL